MSLHNTGFSSVIMSTFSLFGQESSQELLVSVRCKLTGHFCTKLQLRVRNIIIIVCHGSGEVWFCCFSASHPLKVVNEHFKGKGWHFIPLNHIHFYFKTNTLLRKSSTLMVFFWWPCEADQSSSPIFSEKCRICKYAKTNVLQSKNNQLNIKSYNQSKH